MYNSLPPELTDGLFTPGLSSLEKLTPERTPDSAPSYDQIPTGMLTLVLAMAALNSTVVDSGQYLTLQTSASEINWEKIRTIAEGARIERHLLDFPDAHFPHIVKTLKNPQRLSVWDFFHKTPGGGREARKTHSQLPETPKVDRIVVSPDSRGLNGSVWLHRVDGDEESKVIVAATGTPDGRRAERTARVLIKEVIKPDLAVVLGGFAIMPR